MAYDVPETDASPSNLLQVSRGLRDGARTLDQLSGNDDVPLSRSVISETLDYGAKLGFINEDEDGEFSLSDLGWKIGFSDDIESVQEEHFRQAIENHALYHDLLHELIEAGAIDQSENGVISQSQILPLLKTTFGFTELSTDSTLKPATNTFLTTLQAAGYGEYIVGRGGNETRLEVNRGEIPSISDGTETSDGLGDSDGGPEVEGPSKEDVGEEKSGIDDSLTEPDVEGPHTKEQTQRIDQSDVTINIEISSADWDSESVIKLIDRLNENSDE